MNVVDLESSKPQNHYQDRVAGKDITNIIALHTNANLNSTSNSFHMKKTNAFQSISQQPLAEGKFALINQKVQQNQQALCGNLKPQHGRTTSSILFAANQQQQSQQDKKEYKKIDDSYCNLPTATTNYTQAAYNYEPANASRGNLSMIVGGFNALKNSQRMQNNISVGAYGVSQGSQFSCEKENCVPSHSDNRQQNHNLQNLNAIGNVLRPIKTTFEQPLAFNHTQNIFPTHIQVEDDQEEEEEVTLGSTSPILESAALECILEKEHLQYSHEIVQHLKQTENKFNSKGGYIGVVQSEINERMRGILLDWLVEVHYKFKLRTETLFMTINLIDRYLEKIDLKSSQLQLLGITSLFVASKYEEAYSVPHMKDLVYVCDNAYVKEEIFSMEGSILSVLNFNILSVSSFRFLDYFVRCEELGEKNYYLARYLIEIALLEYKMIGVSPSLLAASVIYLVNKIRKRTIAWKQSMIEITSYQEQEIRPCAKQICHIVQSIDQRKYLSSLRKKFQNPQFLEVSKIKIEQRRDNNERESLPQPQMFISPPIVISQQETGQQNQEYPHPSAFQIQNEVSHQVNNDPPQQSSQIVTMPEISLNQVEYVDISVPIQTSMILIEKRIQSLKERPNSMVEAILTNRLCSENSTQVELRVPTQIIVYVIEKKITNVSSKQLWSLPVTFAKVVTQSMFNSQEMLTIPVEFTNFMIDQIISESLRQ